MTRHNKKHYQAKTKQEKRLTLTGKIFLMYRDEEEETNRAQAGDLLVYPSCEPLHTIRQGDYEGTGVAGYFKADISDGRNWCALLVHDIFTDREHHFSKYERPMDTFTLCEEMLTALKGRQVKRTYREHYELIAIEVA